MAEDKRNYLQEATEIINGKPIPVEREHLMAIHQMTQLIGERVQKANEKMKEVINRVALHQKKGKRSDIGR